MSKKYFFFIINIISLLMIIFGFVISFFAKINNILKPNVILCFLPMSSWIEMIFIGSLISMPLSFWIFLQLNIKNIKKGKILHFTEFLFSGLFAMFSAFLLDTWYVFYYENTAEVFLFSYFAGIFIFGSIYSFYKESNLNMRIWDID